MADRTHIIDCDCHHQLHFVQIDYMEWEAPFFDADINLFFCSGRIGGFWRRLARAARYVFGTQELVTGDICVSPAAAREAAKFLNEVADAADAHNARVPSPPLSPSRG